MESAVGLASVFGPILTIIGIWSLFYQAHMKKLVESFKKTPALMYLGGLINLIIGLTILHISPHWNLHLSILVTLLGWICLIRGLIIFFLPDMFLKIIKTQIHPSPIFGIITIVWGLALCWLGYL